MLDVAGEDLRELRFDARRPDSERMADDPERDAGNPELEVEGGRCTTL